MLLEERKIKAEQILNDFECCVFWGPKKAALCRLSKRDEKGSVCTLEPDAPFRGSSGADVQSKRRTRLAFFTGRTSEKKSVRRSTRR
jgi:hypothetical protein